MLKQSLIVTAAILFSSTGYSEPGTNHSGKNHSDVDQSTNEHPGCIDSVMQVRRKLSLDILLANGPIIGEKTVHPWPFDPLSIGHSNASYQFYGGEPYFHHGLDIRGPAGTAVVASAGGKIVNIENYVPGNPAYWEVAVLDEQGYLWQYHHVDRNSIPENIWDSWRRGGSVEAGTKLGEIYRWSVYSYGERYDHVHLNVLGENGVFLSPFLFLDRLPDTKGPVFVNAGVMKNGRAIDASSVSGKYSLYATIHDLIMHEKYVVPPHRIEIAIDGGPTEVVWDFSTLPGGADINKWVHEFFTPSMTCGDYTCRKLTVDLGFINGTVRRVMPTEPGRHQAVVTAMDFEGNRTEQTIDWTISEKF